MDRKELRNGSTLFTFNLTDFGDSLQMKMFGKTKDDLITKNTIDIKRVSLLFLASAYIGIGFSFIAESRHAPDAHGVFWTFLLLVSIWASDAGAYFVGRSMGRHKLWPSISPNKTVEGALGGVLIAVLSALLFAGSE